jgi:hypothetical protein
MIIIFFLKKDPHRTVKYNFVFEEPRRKVPFFFFISFMSATRAHALLREEIPKALHNKPRNEKEAKVPLGRSFFLLLFLLLFVFGLWVAQLLTYTHTRRHGGGGECCCCWFCGWIIPD